MRPSHLECTECRARHDAGVLARLCNACGSPLEARYYLQRVAEGLTRDELARRPATLWRYHELLPLPDPDRAVTLGEGGTPRLHLYRLGERLGLPRLLAKDEAQNPTGSFKARGMSVAVSMARHLGARALAAPSAGNVGGALAAYGARAGLPVVLAMPRDVPIANRIEAEVCGALGRARRRHHRRLRPLDRRARRARGLVRPLDPQGALPRRGQEDDGLRAPPGPGLGAARRHPLPRRRRHGPGRSVEGLRRAA